MAERRLISFDWAMKKLLRAKANFDVLEGFLCELLGGDVRIQEILESGSNKESPDDKSNRVDLKTSVDGELVVIEVQYERQYDYFHRALYGSSRVVTEHIKEGDPYGEVRKVISIHILFFELGCGEDYVYHGRTQFMGLHLKDVLRLSEEQRRLFGKGEVFQVFPEYWLLKVNNFDDVSRDSLDEWVYFLKNERIKGDHPARGLARAAEVLDVMRMDAGERAAYQRYMDDVRHRLSVVKTNFEAGRLAGLDEGERLGLEKGERLGLEKGERLGRERLEAAARNMLARGVPPSEVAAMTGIPVEVDPLLKNSDAEP